MSSVNDQPYGLLRVIIYAIGALLSVLFASFSLSLLVAGLFPDAFASITNDTTNTEQNRWLLTAVGLLLAVGAVVPAWLMRANWRFVLVATVLANAVALGMLLLPDTLQWSRRLTPFTIVSLSSALIFVLFGLALGPLTRHQEPFSLALNRLPRFRLMGARFHNTSLEVLGVVGGMVILWQIALWLVVAYGAIVNNLGIEVLTLADNATAAYMAIGNLLDAILVVGVLVPIGEELFFRGLLLTVLLRRFSVTTAVIISAFSFGLFHAADGAGVVIGTTILGIALGTARVWFKSTWAPIGMHMAHNLLAITSVWSTQ